MGMNPRLPIRSVGHPVNLGRRLIAVILVVFALAVTAHTAHAAPPEVKASENPVVIPDGQNTKPIALTWTLTAAAPKATLTVTDGAATVLQQSVTLPPGSGTVPLTVTFGKTYTAQFRDLNNTPLGQPLTITTKRQGTPGTDCPPSCMPVPMNFGCLQQCITSVDVEPHSASARLMVKTSTDATQKVAVSTKPPNADGEWSNPADVVDTDRSYLAVQQWTAELELSEPNTTHYYAVHATDRQGNTQSKTGTFKTLRQRVEVTFAELHMDDDSDDLSACDCFFSFKAGNEAPKTYGSLGNDLDISTGQTVYPNVTFAIANPPSELKLGAHGTDDDDDWGGGLCEYGAGPVPDWGPSWTDSGSDDCHDWAANVTTKAVPSLKPGQQGLSVPFEIAAKGPRLRFTVRGMFTVSEAP